MTATRKTTSASRAQGANRDTTRRSDGTAVAIPDPNRLRFVLAMLSLVLLVPMLATMIINAERAVSTEVHNQTSITMTPTNTTMTPTNTTTVVPYPLTSTLTPSASIAAPTVTPSTANTCFPTTGTCLSTIEDLANATQGAEDNDVLAICGGATIETSAPVLISRSNVTLCCARVVQEEKCIFTSSTGVHRVLIISGSDSTLQGLVFRNGRAMTDNGGNVKIESFNEVGGAESFHRIIDCEFSGGQAMEGRGGNLYVRTVANVLIQNTIFSNGKALGGGGVMVLDASQIMVTRSRFVNNTAKYNGGGFFSTLDHHDLPGQVILLTDNDFLDNEAATRGGGFLCTAMGRSPRLTAWNNRFERNTALVDGGAGVFLHGGFLDPFAVSLQGNAGIGNEVTDNKQGCNEVAVIAEQNSCVRVEQDYPLGWTILCTPDSFWNA